MADEFFRSNDDFASSDIIYSMREQMTPSDEVVMSLLAKISACGASSEGLDNISSFDNVSSLAPEASSKESSGAGMTGMTKTGGRFKKPLTRRSLVGFASAAAACVIMLTSAFAVMGTGNPTAVGKLIDKIVPGNVITTPNSNSDSNTNGLAAGDESPADTKGADDASKAGGENKAEDASAETTDAVDKTEDASAGENNAQVQAQGAGSSAAPSPAPSDSSLSNSAGGTGQSQATFSREILAEESVSHIAVSGSNYVVDETSASPVTTSEIESISLAIPETSTTNETVVKAHVKKIKNVSSNLMVALDVSGFSGTLLYTNQAYIPGTLGEFIQDAGLDDEASYSKYVYCKGDNIGYSSYHKFTVDDIREYAENYLFTNESAPLSVHGPYERADTHVTFKSKSNPTCSSIDFGVSDNGYLYVKMTSKSFTFYIGSDNAEKFISSITGDDN